MTNNIDTTLQYLETFKEFFEAYPDLPTDWRISGNRYGDMSIQYVYIDGEGVPEMQTIHKVLGAKPRVANGFVTLHSFVEVGDKTIEVEAQMSVVERRREVPKSVEQAALQEVLGG